MGRESKPMARTSLGTARTVQQLVHEFLKGAGVWGIVITDVRATIGDDKESLVIRAEYCDGRSSETTFEGYVGICDLDDVLLATIQELTEKGSDVVRDMPNIYSIGLQESARPRTFPPTLHQREGKTGTPWGEAWLPQGPYPSLMRSSSI